MSAGKVSLVVTVRNEAETIEAFVEALLRQTRPPDELVIVDGGSTDGTVPRIGRHVDAGEFPFPVRLIRLWGANIARGRNAGIEAARHDRIAVTDAGCVPAESWLREIVRPLEEDGGGIVAGNYEVVTSGCWDGAVAAMTIPRPARAAAAIASGRSIAFRRDAWARAGGYPGWLDHAEDTAFILAARRIGIRIRFAPRAVVAWQPRGTPGALFAQYFRYAAGDGRAGHFPRHYALRAGGAVLLAALISLAILEPGAAPASLAAAGGGVLAWWLHFARRVPPSMRTAHHLLLSFPALLLCDAARVAGYARGLSARILHERRGRRP